MFRRVFSSVIFPLVLVSVISLHALMVSRDLPILVATYLPILLAAVIVTGLELSHPFRRAWRPEATDIREDMAFMVIVQTLTPKLLAVATVLVLESRLDESALALSGLWPHALPVGIQAVLMVLLADFMRYWLHRAAHASSFLWSLHAVHHSPQRLYWLNVGRFHPFEKALQLTLDTLPFIVLGVDEHVLAVYLVVYATLGFFQHSNIRLRFGPLNYIFSTAALHRWHHSREAAESNHNFGNNVALWDLLFGTFYLPRGRTVRSLGLRNHHYPRHFVEQLVAPFVPELSHTSRSSPSTLALAREWLLRLVMPMVGWSMFRPLARAARDPRPVQAKTLARILARQRDTPFGAHHGFRCIDSIEAFRRAVPVRDWEAIRPWIEEQERTIAPVRTADRPLFYARTSGTTGKAKHIPVTRQALRNYRAQQRLISYLSHTACPLAFSGKLLGLAGPAVEGRLPSGAPYGSVSGYLYAALPPAVRRNAILPPEVFDIEDYDLRDRLILRLALAERDLTWLAGANPSSFLRLVDVLNEHFGELIESVERGAYPPIDSLPARLRTEIALYLRPDRDRARELRALAHQGELSLAGVWPSIRLVTTWTGGSCGVALESLKRKLPRDAEIMELGYIASEFRGTVALRPGTGAGLPLLRDHFFEFVERERWEQGAPEFLGVEELRAGEEYYVIVTTSAGLYRYFINDLVRVDGSFERTPLLRFTRKGRGVTNITGEKLTESQAIDAVKVVSERSSIDVRFFLLLADEVASRYELLLEGDPCSAGGEGELARHLDEALRDLNVEYEAKRASGRLKAPQAHALRRGVGEAFKRFSVAMGQRESQFKPPVLQHRHAVGFPVDDWIGRSLEPTRCEATEQ